MAYLAAWDVRRAKIFGRCDESTGIAPFHKLVEQVMGQEPYRSAARVFWIMDNGSSHRGRRGDERIQAKWKNIIPVPGLRFHDLRHQAITKLAESGSGDQTIMSIAGHVSKKMLEHYSHIRLEAKCRALEALETPLPEPDRDAAQASVMLN